MPYTTHIFRPLRMASARHHMCMPRLLGERRGGSSESIKAFSNAMMGTYLSDSRGNT